MALIASAAVAIVCFVFRFLLLPSLTNDHFMHLAWAQQLLFGELPGRDFVEPGMPLTVAASAVAQWIRFGPLSEAILTIAMLSLATALTCVATMQLTGSVTAGVAAAFFGFALQPRLYNYPKILVPPATLVLALAYASKPSHRRAAILGLGTACALLFRHDLGGYVALATLVLIAVVGWPHGGRTWRHVATYAAATLLALSPYLVYVAATQGLMANLQDGLEFARAEEHQLIGVLRPPATLVSCLAAGGACAWTSAESAAYLAWLSRVLVPTAAILLVARRHAMPRAVLAPAAAAIALLAMYGTVILRHPLTSRIADLAGVLPIVAVWACVEIARTQRAAGISSVSHAARGAVALMAACGVALAIQSVTVLAQPLELIDRTRLLAGVGKIKEHATDAMRSGLDWPWSRFWPTRELPPAVRYIAACTSASDRLLVTWSAPEYYYFSRRPFAAGHALFLPGAFTSPEHQRLMLERLRRYSVPIVLVNETRRDEFAAAYPEVDAYISRTYVPAGRFINYDDSEIAVHVHRERRARAVYGPNAWPCTFDPPDTPREHARNSQ